MDIEETKVKLMKKVKNLNTKKLNEVKLALGIIQKDNDKAKRKINEYILTADEYKLSKLIQYMGWKIRCQR